MFDKALKSELRCKNEYVILKNRYKHKKHNNMKYCWIVIQVQDNYAKRKYVIQNNEGLIKRFHKQLFQDPKMTLDAEPMRFGNLETKETKREQALQARLGENQ